MSSQTQLPGNLGTIDWTNWVRGLLAATIGGGAGAVQSGFGTMVVDPKDFNIYTGKLYMVMGVCFCFSGIMSMMTYLHNKPIPEIVRFTNETSPSGATKTTETRIPMPPTDPSVSVAPEPPKP